MMYDVEQLDVDDDKTLLLFACPLSVSCFEISVLHIAVPCQSISTDICSSSQLYSGGGGASQPRSKHVSEGNSLRDVAPGNHVHVSYVGE